MTTTTSPAIYVHIPKNGGTTLVRMFIYLFSRRGTVFVYSSPHDVNKNTQSLCHLIDTDVMTGKRVVAGHYAFMPQYADHFPHFTFLRDPVSRQISLYYYILRHPEDPLYPVLSADGMTLERALPLLEDNTQLRYLTNVFDRPLTHADLEQAKYQLEHRFAAFGIVERYDESLILFKRLFGWPMPLYMRENTSSNRPATVSDEAWRIAAEQNAFGAELYAWAKCLFAQRIAEQPPAFADDMREFEERLAQWRKVIGPMWQRWDKFILESRNNAAGQFLRQMRNKIRGY